MGLTAYGRAAGDHDRRSAAGRAARRMCPILLHLGVIYSLFAATGLTYTTFIVTTMIDGLSMTAATAGFLWAGVGSLSIISGGLFGNISDRLGNRAGMLSALLVQAVAYGLVAAGTGMIGLYVSVVLFGLSAWSLPRSSRRRRVIIWAPKRRPPDSPS